VPVHIPTYSYCEIEALEKRYKVQYFDVGMENASILEAMRAKTWGK